MDAKVQQTLHHYINGRKVEGASGRYGPIYNPAIGEVVARAPLASADEVRAAIAAASAAFPAWAETAPGRRAQVMFNFRNLVREHLEELAVMLSAEHGKTVDDAKGSVTRGLEVVEFACGIPQLLKGEYSENVADGVDS